MSPGWGFARASSLIPLRQTPNARRLTMYQPKHFAETRAEVLHALMAAHPLANLVTVQDGLPCADEIPFLLAARAGDGADPLARTASRRALAGERRTRGLCGADRKSVV